MLQISPALIVTADHTLNGGQTEAEGLTGTGLRLTNNVLARQSHGKSQLLDGEGGSNANRREGVANILANAEVGEGPVSYTHLAADYPLTWDDVLAQVGEGNTAVGRPHIADALVAAGVVADRSEAFAKLLYTGSPYYVPQDALDPLEAVRLVREAGGCLLYTSRCV